MTDSLFETTTLAAAVQALRHDLLAEGGPTISTMRNYRFAILPYDPRQEFALRTHMRRLRDELTSRGWNVLSISLQRLLLDRLQAEAPRVLTTSDVPSVGSTRAIQSVPSRTSRTSSSPTLRARMASPATSYDSSAGLLRRIPRRPITRSSCWDALVRSIRSFGRRRYSGTSTATPARFPSCSFIRASGATSRPCHSWASCPPTATTDHGSIRDRVRPDAAREGVHGYSRDLRC